MIPRVLHRVVPLAGSDEMERLWVQVCALHPGWQHRTWRDPLDSAAWPLTSSWWPRCTSGAQLAGLVRLEALWREGGIYLDSDVELYRPLDGLLAHRAFAAWEDGHTIPDAVLGSEPGHPAIAECIALACRRLDSGSDDWVTGSGSWATGPGVTTTILRDRQDVTLLPRQAFYPVHYSNKDQLDDFVPGAGTYGLHRWAGSWLGG
jgi:mannosyltransferase OCH1-like enzyme